MKMSIFYLKNFPSKLICVYIFAIGKILPLTHSLTPWLQPGGTQ